MISFKKVVINFIVGSCVLMFPYSLLIFFGIEEKDFEVNGSIVESTFLNGLLFMFSIMLIALVISIKFYLIFWFGGFIVKKASSIFSRIKNN